MQTRQLVTIALVVALGPALGPALAHADAAKQAADDLDPFYGLWKTMRDDPGSRAGSEGHDPKGADCDAAIERARKAGVKDDARMYLGTVLADLDETKYDDNKQPYVTLADAVAMCSSYRKNQLLIPAAAIQTKSASAMYSYSLVEPGDLGDDMGPVFVKDAKACLEITDKAIASGAPVDNKVKIKDDVMTIREGRTKVCQAYLDWANALGGKIKGAHTADREKRAAPYKAAGVAGKKLDLFLEYDDVYWRGGANCERISDVKKLAKAKALFQWLENPDGTHTIRKYTFNGNKVSGPVNKIFKNAAAAQRGCK